MFTTIVDFFYSVWSYFFPPEDDEFKFVTEIRPLNKVKLPPSPARPQSFPTRPPLHQGNIRESYY